MRRLPVLSVVAIALLAGGPARAQFANKSLGLGLGALHIDADAGVSWGVPLSLEGSLYIENGFDVMVRVPLMVLVSPIDGHQFVGAGLNLGVRYFFSEEAFRPYAGAELAFLYIHRDTDTSTFFGLGPVAGFDYFLSDSISIGPRAFANFFIELNKPVRTTLGAQAVVATYF